MRFRSYDNLRLFDVVARHLSFTAAAEELNLSKGAVSYQMARLEQELGFPLFSREHRGVALTEKGRELWHLSQSAFRDLEREIARLREASSDSITIGVSTYFATRWLSPRLMSFIEAHPQIRLRIQPMVDLIDVRAEPIDMAIRWGRGDWRDMVIEPLFACPAFPTSSAKTAALVREQGLAAALAQATLLHDREDSEAWADWHSAAGLSMRASRKTLVIPDPSVRVQAVIDGQAIALNDALVAPELEDGRLFEFSDIRLQNYGYHLAFAPGALDQPELRAFRDWILGEAQMGA